MRRWQRGRGVAGGWIAARAGGRATGRGLAEDRGAAPAISTRSRSVSGVRERSPVPVCRAVAAVSSNAVRLSRAPTRRSLLYAAPTRRARFPDQESAPEVPGLLLAGVGRHRVRRSNIVITKTAWVKNAVSNWVV